jgi:BCCT family betaine/carnitine transporter
VEDGHEHLKSADDIGHEIGEHNIQVFGLDIHNPVFVVSALLVVALVIGTLLFLEQDVRLVLHDLR